MDFGHNNLSVYSIGANYSKEQWSSIVDRLFDMEAILIDGEYRTLRVTNIGKEILKRQRVVEIDKDDLIVEKSFNDYKQTTPKSEIFEIFKELRTKLSKEENVPAYIIFSDKTLIEISNTLPSNRDEFLAINGVGEQKLEKYGKAFIDLANQQRVKGVKIVKTLSQTYLDTLKLINENMSINDISQKRELKESTIIGHIYKLYENNYIDDEVKNRLYKPLKNRIPDNIKEWIEKGLDLYDIDILRDSLNLYRYLL